MRKRDFLKIVIDLDGTILEEKTTKERPEATPLPGAVDAVNKLYEMGVELHFYSSSQKSLEETGVKMV